MSIQQSKSHNNYVLHSLCQLKSTLLKLTTTCIEYSESLQSSKYTLLRLLNRIIRSYIKTCIGIFKTLYWLLSPNILSKLGLRHSILFGIMFATPSVIRLTVQPCLKYFRYHIFLRIVMGKKWVDNYCSIQHKSTNMDLTYEQHIELVSKLDTMDGLDTWRVHKSSHLYSYQRIQTDSIQLRKLKEQCSQFKSCSNIDHPISELMEFLRSRIERNYCGITNPKLYSVTKVGTKRLIEDFVDKMTESLNYIAATNTENISVSEKIIYFQELRHVLGRTALCLSGGGGLSAYHVGVVLAMHFTNLLPKIITGSSGGSVIAAILCTKLDDQLTDLVKDGVLNAVCLERNHPTQHRSWISTSYVRLRRFWKTGYWMDATILRDSVKEQIGDITFLEAYQKTGRILNITVSGSDANTMPRLLNFLTAPNVVIWSAVIASCAIPSVYAPQELFVKSYINEQDNKYKIEPIYLQGATFSDGSLSHDLPMDKLSQLFNVDNFIVSQVNPHLVPFLFHSIIAPIPLFQRVFNFLCREYTLYLTTILINLRATGILKGLSIMNNLFTQKYTGDVTIVPDIPIADYLGVLSNPTLPYIQRCAKLSAKSMYKHISRLQALCEIEFTIDKCLNQLRGQLFINGNTLPRVNSFQAPHTQSHCDEETMNRLHIPQTIYNSMTVNDEMENNTK